jgi:hypothetical protein
MVSRVHKAVERSSPRHIEVSVARRGSIASDDATWLVTITDSNNYHVITVRKFLSFEQALGFAEQSMSRLNML